MNSLANRAFENAANLNAMLNLRKSQIETLARRESVAGMDWAVQEPILTAEAERLGFEYIPSEILPGRWRVPIRPKKRLPESTIKKTNC